jgi:hypothetical protein
MSRYEDDTIVVETIIRRTDGRKFVSVVDLIKTIRADNSRAATPEVKGYTDGLESRLLEIV